MADNGCSDLGVVGLPQVGYVVHRILGDERDWLTVTRLGLM